MTNGTTVSNDATLFGMPVRTGRWAFVLAGMLMNVCLGTVYAWSVFRKPVADKFSTADVKITATQTLWPFMLFLALFTVLMPISGRIVQKVHPRTVSLVGSLIVAAGWILSGYATGVNFLNVTYGVIAGAGVGIVYGIPIAVVTRWFPDLKGLAVGLTVLGFGMSALVTAPLAKALIAASGILNAFLILGIAFLVSLVLMSLLMRFPPAGWRPEGWQGAAAAASERSFTPSEMLKTSSCYGLWLCFIIGSLSGLMAIGITKDVGTEIIKLDDATATGLLSFFALFNGGGRPLFGWLSDAIGHSKAAALSLLLIVLASGAMVLLAREGSVVLYAACFAAFWMGLGSWLAIAPTATATYFGPKNYATNYGIIFSAYGIGAILATYSAGFAKDIFGSYIHAFHVSGSLATLGVIIALILMKEPKTA
jgi:MFS transporter, OFA family, oxalate/formate antiporter